MITVETDYGEDVVSFSLPMLFADPPLCVNEQCNGNHSWYQISPFWSGSFPILSLNESYVHDPLLGFDFEVRNSSNSHVNAFYDRVTGVLNLRDVPAHNETVGICKKQ